MVDSVNNNPDSGPDGNESATVDPALINRLVQRLSKLTDEVLGDQSNDIATEIAQRKLDRDRLRNEALSDTDAILRPTNPEIIAIWEAQQAVVQHRNANGRGTYYRNDGRDGKLLSLWLMAILPMAAAEYWNQLQAFAGTLLAVLTVVLLGGLIVIVQIATTSTDIVLTSTSSAASTDPATSSPRTHSRRARVAVAYVCIGVFTMSCYIALIIYDRSQIARYVGLGWAIVIFLIVGVVALVAVAVLLFEGLDGEDQQGWALSLKRSASRFYITFGAAGGLILFTPLPVDPMPSSTVSNLLAAMLVSLVWPYIAAVIAHFLPDPNLPGSAGWRKLLAELENQRLRLEHQWAIAARDELQQVLRSRISALVQPPFSRQLTLHSTTSLQLLRAPDSVIRTKDFRVVADALRRLAGGTVGVSGPRGSGKITLLEHLRDGRLLEVVGKQHVAVMLSVPVRFDPRDFVLHLYARVCGDVIDTCRSLMGDGGSSRSQRYRKPNPISLAVGLIAALTGYGYVLAKPPSFLTGPNVPPLALPLAGAIALALISSFVVAWSRKRRYRPVTSSRLLSPPKNLSEMQRLAEEKLEYIQFHQKFTSGWSGKLVMPVAGELAESGTREKTRQPFTYPDVVHDFQQFMLAAVTTLKRQRTMADVPIMIIVDELDKIASEDQAQELLNDLKVLFSIDYTGCLFLVSVSLDALASFERRGIPMRDAFDSTFDNVYGLGYLSYEDAREMLQSRVLGIPAPFIALIHILAGGLPRDLIRLARVVCAHQEGEELFAIMQRMVTDDLARKSTSILQSAARDLLRTDSVIAFMGLLAEPTPFDEPSLTRMVREALTHLADEMPNEGRSLLKQFQLEWASYGYFLLTILQIFGPLDEAGMTQGTQKARDTSFDLLSKARQQFAIDPEVAWSTISRSRRAWGIRALDPRTGR